MTETSVSFKIMTIKKVSSLHFLIRKKNPCLFQLPPLNGLSDEEILVNIASSLD